MDLTGADATPLEIPLPAHTAAYDMGWATDGTLVVGTNNVDGRRDSGNVFLVRPDGETRLLWPRDNSIVFAGDRVVTGLLGTAQVHVIDPFNAVRTVALQSVSGAGPRGSGLGGSPTMIATGLTDGTLAVFDWQGTQRATVVFDEQPSPIGPRPISGAGVGPSPQGPWYPQVNAIVNDAAGQGLVPHQLSQRTRCTSREPAVNSIRLGL